MILGRLIKGRASLKLPLVKDGRHRAKASFVVRECLEAATPPVTTHRTWNRLALSTGNCSDETVKIGASEPIPVTVVLAAR